VRWFRRRYGAGPLHLVGVLSVAIIAVYALWKVHEESGVKKLLFWFVLSLVFCDLVAWPIYTVVDRMAIRAQERHQLGRRQLVPWINHIRVPTVISAVLFVMFLPLILRLDNTYFERAAGFSENVYIVNWVMVSVALFAGSALIYLMRLMRASRRTRSSDKTTSS
jgi:Na+/melibiose symporter-like transporter